MIVRGPEAQLSSSKSECWLITSLIYLLKKNPRKFMEQVPPKTAFLQISLSLLPNEAASLL
jgi:hypothetical protein